MCILTCPPANTDIETHMCVYNDNYISQYLLRWTSDLIKQNHNQLGLMNSEKLSPGDHEAIRHSL